MKPYYDTRCLDTNVAIRAVFLLWRRRAWTELADLGLGKEIHDAFDDASMDIPGYRLRNDMQTKLFLSLLPFELQARVIAAAKILTRAYRVLYAHELASDDYTRRSRR